MSTEVSKDTRLCGDVVWSAWSVFLTAGQSYRQIFGAYLETVEDFFAYFGPVDWSKIHDQSIFAIMKKDIQPQWESEEVTHKVNLGWENLDVLIGPDRDCIMKLLWAVVTGAFNKSGDLCGIYSSTKVKQRKSIKMELWYDRRKTKEIDLNAIREVLKEIDYPISTELYDEAIKK